MRRGTQLRAAMFCLVAMAVLWPATAHAQRRGGGRHDVVFVGGYFYDPFYGPYPWWGPTAYPYYPVYDERAELRVLVTPKQAAVYVDGYYAGIVDDFDGFFQRLRLPPGEHEIDVYLEGYRTVHQRLGLTRGRTYRLVYTMERLASGETSEPPPAAPPVPPPPPGTAVFPRTPRGGPGPELPPAPPQRRAEAAGFGTLVIRVQPADAEIMIDGEPWTGSEAGARLLVQVAEGSRHVEIRKSGYRPFVSDITVRRNETVPLNVSLSPE